MKPLSLALAMLCFLVGGAKAETVQVGTTRLVGYVGVPVGIALGYFKAEGLEVKDIYFTSAEPIAVATASGDVDFGVCGPSAGFYNLAAHGQVKLIGASGGDAKGFHALEFLASNKAYAAGLKSPHDLPGHSVGITQPGTALHNIIGILAERDGFPMSAVQVKPLQSNSAVTSALIGGTVDAAVMPNGPILNLVTEGKIKFLGWTSDYAPNKAGVMLLVSKRDADQRGDMVRRFLAAYRKAARDIHDAFTAPDGTRRDGPTAPAIIKIIADFTGLPPELVEKGAPAMDPEARINISGYDNQIAWLRSQGFLKTDIHVADLIDKRYALTSAEGR
ncbi:MAG TPA: ABC transporter substrate-binding protein [Stellaceae bacterium]|nr:ABC transporter substrate-binding protein [Stellaceae bacterium]